MESIPISATNEEISTYYNEPRITIYYSIVMDYAEIIWDKRNLARYAGCRSMTAIIVFTMNRMKHPVPLNMAGEKEAI